MNRDDRPFQFRRMPSWRQWLVFGSLTWVAAQIQVFAATQATVSEEPERRRTANGLEWPHGVGFPNPFFAVTLDVLEAGITCR